MARVRASLGVGLSVAMVVAAAAFAPGARAEDRHAFDRRIVAELEAQDADAARLFREANEAREKGDYTRAKDLYEQVRKLAPTFDHATRRLCGVESDLGHREQAIALCREALRMAPSAPNLSALANALLAQPAHGPDLDEAERLVVRAVSLAPDDVFARQVECQIGIAKQEVGTLIACVNQLEAIAPQEPSTHAFAFVLALVEGRLGDARDSLEKARELGLPPGQYARLSEQLEEATPLYQRIFAVGWKVAVAWCGAFALLLAVGSVLSRLALRAAGKVPERIDGHPQGAEKTLRRVYRAVLWLCCGFYYLSIPLLLVLVALLGAGLIYAFFAIGTIPIKLVLIIAVVTFTTIGSVLKSLFVRANASDPGMHLDLADHPKLRDVLAEVAGKIGTSPVDKVFFTPGTDIAVMERSGMRGLLGGKSERCLILGAGVLRGMKILPFKSILAHEHGHFHNEDTAGGGFALAVRRSLMTMAIALARGGVAAWYNPVWLFLRAFYKVFLVISQGASRLQEVLADRWAVRAYGSDAFQRGLEHVIRRSARFDAHVDATLNEVVAAKAPLLNLYTYKPEKKPDAADAIEKALNAEPSAYDSHPAPKDRIAWAAALAVPDPAPSPDDDEPAWDLFSDRRHLEEEMTDRVRAKVLASHGVAIPRPKRKPKPAEGAPPAEAPEDPEADASSAA